MSTDMTTLHTVAALSKTLGHPGRLRILALLRTAGPLSVCQIATALETPASTISGHLSELRRVGLLCEQRTGKWIHCRLAFDEDLFAMVAPVLAAIADDAEIRRDAAAAAALRGRPLAAVCAAAMPGERRTS